MPAAVYTNWVLQTRVAGAVARLNGHDLTSPRVRTLCLLCLLGDSAWGVLKSMGVRAMEQAARYCSPLPSQGPHARGQGSLFRACFVVLKVVLRSELDGEES